MCRTVRAPFGLVAPRRPTARRPAMTQPGASTAGLPVVERQWGRTNSCLIESIRAQSAYVRGDNAAAFGNRRAAFDRGAGATRTPNAEKRTPRSERALADRHDRFQCTEGQAVTISQGDGVVT